MREGGAVARNGAGSGLEGSFLAPAVVCADAQAASLLVSAGLIHVLGC